MRLILLVIMFWISKIIIRNNVLLTSDAALGTMQAGVVGAKRGTGFGGDGIMDQAEIIGFACEHTGNGEPYSYLEGLALAIRYAVGAQSRCDLCMPEQYTLDIPSNTKTVDVRGVCELAESKGVLVVVPEWELSRDLFKNRPFFPNRWMTGGKEN